MNPQKTIISLIGLCIIIGSLYGIRHTWKKDIVKVSFINESCAAPVTFQVIYQNGNFNNGGNEVECGKKVSREIYPAGETSFRVTVFDPKGRQVFFDGGSASEYDGSSNIFVFTSEKKIELR